MSESVKPFTHSRMLILNETTSAHVAARAMYENRYGSVVVTNGEGEVKGIVTDRDLSTQVLGFDWPADTPLAEFMTDEVFCVSDEDSLEDVIDTMVENGVRRVPILSIKENGKQKCVGMVALDDLIASKMVTIDELSRIVKSQVTRRFHRTHTNPRSEAHQEHTLNRFYKIIAESMKLDRDFSEGLTFYLIKQISQRLPLSGSVHLISQLPKLLHEDLLNLPVGPNRHITSRFLIDDIGQRFGFDPEDVPNVLRQFGDALTDALGGELAHVAAQLPKKMAKLFFGEPEQEASPNRLAHLVETSAPL